MQEEKRELYGDGALLVRKVCILGPVPDGKSAAGGVAVFDAGLAEGFRRLGAEVFLCTEQAVESAGPVYQINLRNARAIMEKEQPELILASLQYGKYFPLLKKWGPRVLLLHGYFNFRDYGMPKALAAVAYQKFMAQNADLVLANSNLTKVMNGLFWDFPSDGVIPLGTTNDYIEQAKAAGVIRNAANGRVLYMGRLVNNKQVDRVIRAGRLLHEQGIDCPLEIAGSGPEEDALRQLAEGDGNISFRGFVPHEDVYSLLHETDVFVSLSESESFGIAFAEALMAGCKIVCPNTGGQIAFLSRYPERVRFLPDMRPETVAGAIRELLDTSVGVLPSEDVCGQFDYKSTALSILDHLKELHK